MGSAQEWRRRKGKNHYPIWTERKDWGKSEQSFRDTWDYREKKKTNIDVIGVLEEEEKGSRAEKVFDEIMAENLPNLEKGLNLQI